MLTLVEGQGLETQTAPSAEPLTLSDAREHLHVDHFDDDSYINGLIATAREYVERVTGRAMITQTLDESFDDFPNSSQAGFLLSRGPIQSVSSITYHDEDLSTSTVLSSSNYQVDTSKVPAVVVLKDSETWPSDSLRLSSGVVIRYVAGYGDNASDVPDPLVHAVMLLIGHWYQHRESTMTGTIIARIPDTVDALLAPYKTHWF